MSHIVYGLFDGYPQARATLARLVEAGIPVDRCSLLGHKDHLKPDDGMGHSDAARGLSYGLAAGVVVGAVLGALIAGPFGLLGIGPLAGAFFGAGGGSVIGGLSGGLAGAGLPDASLAQLTAALERGQVLVGADCTDPECEQIARRVLEEQGALPIPAPMAAALPGG